jgi:hypothetical protein
MANTGALNTGSTLQYTDGLNKTSTALSTNIIIKVNNIVVGAIQTLTVNETRAIKSIDEVGTDGHIDSTPQKSTDITVECSRIRFDRLRVAEAFSRSFVHASSQIYPFDIIIMDKQKQDKKLWISTIIKNCWINKISYAFNIGDWTITDNMGLQAETIYSVVNAASNSVIGSASNAVAIGGERGLSVVKDKWWGVERSTDTGGRRGSMDVAGIIDVGGSDWK